MNDVLSEAPSAQDVWEGLEFLLSRKSPIPMRCNGHWAVAEDGLDFSQPAIGHEFTLNASRSFGIKAKALLAEIAKEGRAASRWHALINREQIRQGFANGPGMVFFNLEIGFLHEPDYAELLIRPDFLFESDVLGHRNRLVAEITERDPLGVMALNQLQLLSDSGFKFALDDVGKDFMNPLSFNGNTNLARILEAGLPIYAIKLDRMYVEHLATEKGLKEAQTLLTILLQMGFPPKELILEGCYMEQEGWLDAVLKLRAFWLSHGGTTLAVSGIQETTVHRKNIPESA